MTEVENVGYPSYTQQLKDSFACAEQNDLQFDPDVGGGAKPTVLSAPLNDAIAGISGFNLKVIP